MLADLMPVPPIPDHEIRSLRPSAWIALSHSHAWSSVQVQRGGSGTFVGDVCNRLPGIRGNWRQSSRLLCPALTLLALEVTLRLRGAAPAHVSPRRQTALNLRSLLRPCAEHGRNVPAVTTRSVRASPQSFPSHPDAVRHGARRENRRGKSGRPHARAACEFGPLPGAALRKVGLDGFSPPAASIVALPFGGIDGAARHVGGRSRPAREPRPQLTEA